MTLYGQDRVLCKVQYSTVQYSKLAILHMTLYGQDRVVCTVQYSTINYQYCILPFRRMVKTGHCNVCELDSTASCTGKGSRKKSSTLNGRATKALPPPPPRAQWP